MTSRFWGSLSRRPPDICSHPADEEIPFRAKWRQTHQSEVLGLRVPAHLRPHRVSTSCADRAAYAELHPGKTPASRLNLCSYSVSFECLVPFPKTTLILGQIRSGKSQRSFPPIEIHDGALMQMVPVSPALPRSKSRCKPNAMSNSLGELLRSFPRIPAVPGVKQHPEVSSGFIGPLCRNAILRFHLGAAFPSRAALVKLNGKGTASELDGRMSAV
jgi:hypothetical protein